MNICCINPPLQDFYCTSLRRQPIGLLYVIGALEHDGHRVSFINGHTPKKHIIPIPSEFSYLEPFFLSDNIKTRFPYKNYCHYGASFQEIARQIKNCDSEIYFISCLFTTYYEEASEIITIIRKLKKNAIIVTGGYHSALYPDYYLLQCGADYVITGEGEKAAVNLIEYLSGTIDISEVQNLCYLENNSIRTTGKENIKNLDSIPFPARDHLKLRDFRFYTKNGTSIISSRGCPNRCDFCTCDFCTSRDLWGNKYRIRDVDALLKEIDLCIQRYNLNLFNFEDDNLMASREHTQNLLTGLLDYQKKKKITLDLTAMNGLSLESIDEDIVLFMSRVGFHELNVSLVSQSNDILKKHVRPFDSNKVKEISLFARSLGMRVRAYFILGLPDQTRDEIEETISFMHDLGVMIFPSVYYDVKRPKEEWKTQRSSAFFNESKNLNIHDLLYFFNLALSMNKKLNNRSNE